VRQKGQEGTRAQEIGKTRELKINKVRCSEGIANMGNISIPKGGAKACDREREWRLIQRGGTCDSGSGGGLSVLIGMGDRGN